MVAAYPSFPCHLPRINRLAQTHTQTIIKPLDHSPNRHSRRRGHALREANALVKKLSDSSSVYNVATVNLAKRRAKLKQAKGAEVKADRRLAKIVLAREEKEAKRGGCEKSEDEDESEDGESSDDFISDEDLGGDEIDATGARKEDNQEQEKELERAKANKYRKQGKNALMSSFNGRNGHHVFASDLPGNSKGS